MGIKTLIGLGDELLVKTFLAATGLIASRKQDCLAPCVECKGDTPFSVSGAKNAAPSYSRAWNRYAYRRGAFLIGGRIIAAVEQARISIRTSSSRSSNSDSNSSPISTAHPTLMACKTYV